MALQMQHETQFGLTLENAYVRILSFRGDRENVMVCAGFYASKEARDLEKPAIETTEFSLSTPNAEDNFFAAIYAHMKTLPQFTSAIDV